MATFHTFAPPPVSPELRTAHAQTTVLIPPPPAAKPAKSVLIVDDDRTWLSALTRLLEREGFTVATATNAGSALKALKGTKVDLIVSDLNMPRMDGLELRDAICADSTHAAIPFIFVSGSLDESNRHAARGLGVAHFLEKTGPITELTSLANDLAS
jgi:two-component system chemotaxis response regulator CheY